MYITQKKIDFFMSKKILVINLIKKPRRLLSLRGFLINVWKRRNTSVKEIVSYLSDLYKIFIYAKLHIFND